MLGGEGGALRSPAASDSRRDDLNTSREKQTNLDSGNYRTKLRENLETNRRLRPLDFSTLLTLTEYEKINPIKDYVVK